MNSILKYLIALIFILFAHASFARVYTTGSNVVQYDGPLDPGDVGQKLLRIELNVGTGAGTPTCSGMQFNITNFADVATARLYTTNQSATFTGATLLSSLSAPFAGTLNFAFGAQTNNNTGLWYYWLVIDMKSSITVPNLKVDASYTTGTYATGPPTFTTTNPNGFRYTARNYKIGTGEDYINLKDVADGISRFDYDGSSEIFMELTGNYASNAETNGVQIIFSNHSGPSNITIRPMIGVTGRITQAEGASSATFIWFNGAKKIIFDGRAGGVGVSEWLIRNTRTAAQVGPVIRLQNDADNNQFRYIRLESEVESNLVGMFQVFQSTASSGNRNIKVSNCIFTDLSVGGTANIPAGGFASSGSTGLNNSLLYVDSCQFVNIYSGTSAAFPININLNTDSTFIRGNHIYQTTSYSNLAYPSTAIYIYSGINHTVLNNYIGGQAPYCGGPSMNISSGTFDFTGITFNTLVSGTQIVSGNTISNISYTTTASTVIYPFIGISLQGTASYTCGSNGNPNVIGSMSSTGNILLTNNGATSSWGICGIYYNSTGTSNIQYNQIGGITLNGSRTGAQTDMISANNASGNLTIANNVIGGTVSNSIVISSNSPFSGITKGNSAALTANYNTLQNITHNAAAMRFIGIGTLTANLFADNNTIKNITTSSDSTVRLIYQGFSTGLAIVSNNIIESINLTGSVAPANSRALECISAYTSGDLSATGNVIGNTSANNISISSNSELIGIYKNLAGVLTVNNNIIRNLTNNNSSASATVRGIDREGTGALSASGNTISNLTCYTAVNSVAAVIGILCNSSSTSHAIASNTISGVYNLSTTANSPIALGIALSTGGGMVEKNKISDLANRSTLTTASIQGFNIFSGAWTLENNFVDISNAPYTNAITAYGMYEQEATATTTIYHNTFKISGSVVGNATSAAYRRQTAGVDVIKNNLFVNNRTGGTGGHFAEYAVAGGTYTSDFNYLEATDNSSKVGSLGATPYSFAGWKTAIGATNDVTGTVTINSVGKITSNNFTGAGTGTNLFATVPVDLNNVSRLTNPWMGAYESVNITTVGLGSSNVCAGSSIAVNYTIGGADPFNSGNIFTAQLSDAAGSFASPTNIGTLNSISSGSISATIPGGTPAGVNYLIRVVSSDPYTIGNHGSITLTVYNGPPGAFNTSTFTSLTCSGFSANWNASTNATSYSLDVALDASFTFLVPGYNNLNVGLVTTYAVSGLNSNTNYYYRVRAINPCGTTNGTGTINVLTTGTPQTYVVTSNANGAVGDGVSLRWAITQANTNCGHDTIVFNLGAGGPFTISLTAPLPDLTDNSGVTINGFENGTNDGSPNTVSVFNATTSTPLNANYKIILSNAGTIATGLSLVGNNNVIKGLVIKDFGDGTPSVGDVNISVASQYNKILGCYIGMSADGITGGNNSYNGILLTGKFNEIGNGTAAGANLISGMKGTGRGIQINSSSGRIKVQGNIIGLQKDGATIVSGANQYSGITITNSNGFNNIIGGTTVNAGNVISGNNGVGIYTSAQNSALDTIAGNIIGPAADGNTNITSNPQGTGIECYTCAYTLIGGYTVNSRNIISANTSTGITIKESSYYNTIFGNYIGTNITGTAVITGSTQLYGVNIISNSYENYVGIENYGNVISGNTAAGIYIGSDNAAGNKVYKNIIGLQADGNSFIASSSQTNGINLNETTNNLIGGSNSGFRNIISGNDGNGIYLTGGACSTNVIKGNYIGLASNGISVVTNSNQDYGIYLLNYASNNIIGGDASLGEGNVISGNYNGSTGGTGVYLAGSAGNTVRGNIIGAQADGNSYVTSNLQYIGLSIVSSGNIIGSNNSAYRNIISGNEQQGISLSGAACSTNVIKGNYIGIALNGTSFITGSSQNYGILISSSAGNNIIGGDATLGEGNLISGNNDGTSTGRGIYSSSVNGNLIKGNIIGTQSDGVTYITGNLQNSGIELANSKDNIIGGNSAADRNVISANETYGIYLTGAACSTNVIKGNYIGLASDGDTKITSGSQDYGVYITLNAGGNTIGGDATAGEGNVISGNISNGIYINSAAATGNTIIGNTIGPQKNGLTDVTANPQSVGITLITTRNNVVGGSTSAHINIVSANLTTGITLSGASCSTNVVKGNYIGIAADGSSFITGSTQDIGISIVLSAVNNIIGGSNPGEGNVISGNKDGTSTGRGVYITSTAAGGNTVIGNIIGPQADGITYVTGNGQQRGLELSNSRDNVIGGNNSNDRNIISANETYGVILTGAACSTNVIKGNYIGISSDGINRINSSTQDYGVYFTTGAVNNTLGGIAAGEGNVISANSSTAVYSISTGGNNIFGNIIGPQSDGNSYVATNPQLTGIFLSGSPNNIVGGNTIGHRNIVSANEQNGIVLSGAACSTNVIKGNYVGIAQDGINFISGSSQDRGIYIQSSSSNNTIGGTAAGEGNVISGNADGTSTGRGISLVTTTNNTIVGNIIGPQSDGFSYVIGNLQNRGIDIVGASSNTIGGNTVLQRNIISANESYGVYINGAASTGNVLIGNYLGPASTLVNVTGSAQDYGVYINGSASSNIIGTTNALEGNTIAENKVGGVFLNNTGTINNKISGNVIYNNSGKAIELNYGANQANGGKPIAVINSASASTVSGTSQANDIIELFYNTTGDCNDAVTFLGVDTADGSGNWSITGLSLISGDYVLVTARNASNNTSEFSTCQTIAATFYWVGNAGDWNVNTNWSNSSGGTGGVGVPNATDDVIFDSNSLSTHHEQVAMPAGIWECKSLQLQDINLQPSFVGPGTLKVTNP